MGKARKPEQKRTKSPPENLPEGLLVAREGPVFRLRTQDGRTLRALVRSRILRVHGPVMVGDRVRYRELPGGEAVVEDVLPRSSFLPHPPVANVDQVLIVVSLVEPDLDEWLLNRLVLAAEAFGLETTLVLNKVDRVSREEVNAFLSRYRDRVGYPVIPVSARTGENLEALERLLEGKISVLAGPSGVGKSALLNRLIPGASLKEGEVSHKTGRGRHTTTWVELLPFRDGWVADTPGFSRLELGAWIEPEELDQYMRDFQRHLPCAFRDCTHTDEPGCAIREALERGDLDPFRYRFYFAVKEELEEARAWRRKK